MGLTLTVMTTLPVIITISTYKGLNPRKRGRERRVMYVNSLLEFDKVTGGISTDDVRKTKYNGEE